MEMYIEKEVHSEPLVIHYATTTQPNPHMEENKSEVEKEKSKSSYVQSPNDHVSLLCHSHIDP